MKFYHSVRMPLIQRACKPNIINEIINYDYSTLKKMAPRIMALEPQDDNRDGVANRAARTINASKSTSTIFNRIFRRRTVCI